MKFFKSVTLVLLLNLSPIIFLGAQPTPKNGECHSTIEREIDNLCTEYIERYNLAGLTVAASLEGRIVLTKGYGYSDKGAKIQMQPFHRTFIGSVSKMITAFGIMKLLEETGDRNVNSKLYSQVFRDQAFRNALKRGSKRNGLIAALAMDSDGRVYTWYMNNKYSIGTPQNPTRESVQDFSLPAGKTVYDIVAIAINGIYVYAFYRDRSYSIGNASTLDLFKQPIKNEVTLPFIPNAGDHRYEMRRILGMAYVNGWDLVTLYDDGTMSAGAPENLAEGFHLIDERIKESSDLSRYDIRGIAGSKQQSELFIWYSNQKFTSGSLAFLAESNNNPRNYFYPVGGLSELMEVRYNDLSILHLLTHTSGVSWTLDTLNYGVFKYGPESMFNFSQSPWTAEKAALQHQYLLSTQYAKFDPGTHRKYHNNNYGFLGFLPFYLKGEEYGKYIQRKLFAPLGVSGQFANYRGPRAQNDATPYNMGNAGVKDLLNHANLNDPDRGLANVSSAGGWASNAESLLKILLATDGESNHPDLLSVESVATMEQLDLVPVASPERERIFSIGWGGHKLERGYRYEHNGTPGIGGGYSWLTKFSKDAIVNDQDRSNISIAICQNTGDLTAGSREAFRRLRLNISNVIAAHRHEIDATYDLYDGISNRKVELSGIGLFRPSTRDWRLNYNLDGKAEVLIENWGREKDIPLAGDFNGDGIDEIVIFRPNERKWFFSNVNGSRARSPISGYGKANDIPFCGDFNGDGRDEIGLFRPESAEFRIDSDLDGHSDKIFQWGRQTDIPVTGDFNGDGIDGMALFRPGESKWFIRDFLEERSNREPIENYGNPGSITDDIPVSGDFNQDGKCDIGIFRPSTGEWRLDFNLDGHSDHIVVWGASDDIPFGL